MHKSIKKYVTEKKCDYSGDGIANGERSTKYWKRIRSRYQRRRLKRTINTEELH